MKPKSPVSVPPTAPQPRGRPISGEERADSYVIARVPASLLARFTRVAKRRKSSRSALLRAAVEEIARGA